MNDTKHVLMKRMGVGVTFKRPIIRAVNIYFMERIKAIWGMRND